mmetsp:Transcript_6913/g.13694  ORF Transcript_6913/g.13694 Transcript_6913/m.13694 type:complete len:273 (+) Transcript_6913:1779-2597(+)
MEGLHDLSSGRHFLFHASAVFGAAAALENRNRAHRFAFEVVVIDHDGRTEERHDENVVPEDDECSEDAEGPCARDRGEARAEEGHARCRARDRHCLPGLPPHPRHARLQVLVDFGSLVLGLIVSIHEDENVVGADGAHDEDGQHVEAREVLDLEDAAEEEPRAGDREKNLRHADQRKEQRTNHVPDVEEDEDDGADGSHGVHEDDLQEHLEDEQRHEVEGVCLLAVTPLRHLLYVVVQVVHNIVLDLFFLIGFFVINVLVAFVRPPEKQNRA